MFSKIVKHLISIAFVSTSSIATSAASAQSDAVVDKMLKAQYCVDSYSTKVFLDGAPGQQATPIAMVQCSEFIAEYADQMLIEMENLSGEPFSEADRSKLLARLVFDLFDRQNNLMTGGKK
ncbi:hypothetical protein K4L04_03920 [Phaeobacter inhibens]|uniref:hypothetical protein n=1 Tax=Phaeobacter inhibens TaxID=221822 RepID=UPI0021A7528B|nr:hypothetical protein [Phaeobacter inhibens]UWR77116.1 hypothetical protein K4L04_03920 [Phaeobacter inhibens]